MKRRRDFGYIRKQGSSRFVVRAYVVGRRIKRTFATKAAAEGFLARLRTSRDVDAALGVRPVVRIGFAKAVDKCLSIVERKHSASTFQSESPRLLAAGRHFGGMHLDEVQTSDVENYLTTLKRSGIAGRNRVASLISALFKRMKKLGHCRSNPVQDVERTPEAVRDVPVLSAEERQRLFDACPDRIRPLVEILVGTGLRAGEALRLEWRDYDGVRRTLSVRRSKSGKPRHVPVTTGVASVLEGLLAARGPVPLQGPNRIFADLPTDPRSGSIQGAWKRALRAARLDEGMHLHDCRHLFSVDAVRRGVPLNVLAAVLGHSTLAMVSTRYARHAPSNATDLARKLLDAPSPIEGEKKPEANSQGA